jgi:hypothetical protein
VTDAPFWETSTDPDPGIADVPPLDDGVLAFPSGIEIVGKVEQISQLIAQQIALALDGISFLGINPFLALQQFGQDPGSVISTILIGLGGGGTGLTGLATAMGDVGAVVSDVTQLTAAFGTTGINDVIDAIQLTQALSNAIENALEGGDATTTDAAQVQAALTAFLSNNTEAIGAAQQTVLNVIANGLGQPTGTNYTPTQVEGFVTDIPGDAVTAAQSVVQALENGLAVALGLPATSGVNYTVAQIQAQLEDQLASFLLLSTWQSFINAIVGGTTGTATQLFTILSNAVAGVVDLETQLSGFSPSSVLSQLIALFPGTASGLSGLTGLGGIFSDLVGFVGSPTGLGSGSPASSVSATSVPALRGLFSDGTFLTSLIPNLNAAIITAGTLSSSLIEGIEGAGTTLLGDVSDIISGAGATTASGAGTIISDASGAISDATNVLSGAVTTAETALGSALGGAFGGLLGLIGVPATSASSAQVQSAAQAVAAAQAAQAQETAAINAQLPKFYGGSGVSGLSAQVSLSGSLPSSFTNKGPLTATVSGTSTPGAQFAALFDMVADTDQETVSGIWSSPIVINGGARYLFLRVNSGFTSYLFAKWFATGTTAAAVFNASLGCVVAGVEHVFATFTESADGTTAQFLIDVSANNNISLEATAGAISFTYPQGTSTVNASIAFSDTSGVSQIGASFRQAGWGTDEETAGALTGVDPVFDAIGSGGNNNGVTNTHTATAGATVYALVVSSVAGSISSVASISSVTYGSAAMTQIGDTSMSNAADALALYELVGAPGGAQTLHVSAAGDVEFCTISYTGVSSTGAPATVSGVGSSSSQSLTCAAGQSIVQAFGSVFSFTADSGGTNRFMGAFNSSEVGLAIQDSATSTTFTATASAPGGPWSGIGVVLSGPETTAPVFPASFAFFDSGPTAGPQASPIVTPQTSLTTPPTGTQNTTSTTFAELATTTDQVTVNIGPSGIALVFLSFNATNSAAGQANYASFAMSGANTAAASFSQAVQYQPFAASSAAGGLGGMFPVTGLTPGATTFKMEYATSGGAGQFWNRRIFVLPI